jgi:hypothetical protein
MSRWRRATFSIRGLLVLILVVGVALGAWFVPYRRYRRQVDLASMLVARQTYFRGDGNPIVETRPCWQARLIGDKRTGPLTVLRVYGPLSGEEIARVAEFRDLEVLSFCSIIDPKGDGLAPLAGLPSLRSLDLTGGSLGAGWKDSDLSALKDFRHLEELTIFEDGFTDAGLAHLGEMTGLRKLTLYCGYRTDASLAFLGRMKGLRSLSLLGSSATDAILDTVRPLPHLERLELTDIPITDDGLSRLVGLDRLEFLRIFNAKIDGRGLASLARLPRLRELRLEFNNDLKDAAVDELKKALPVTKVEVE